MQQPWQMAPVLGKILSPSIQCCAADSRFMRTATRPNMTATPASLWQRTLELLRTELTPNAFTMWIQPLRAEETPEGLRLFAFNPHFTNTLNKTYRTQIERAVRQISGQRDYGVEILLDAHPQLGLPEDPAAAAAPESGEAPLPVPESRAGKSRKKNLGTSLNPLFTFENFIEGPSNQMAAKYCHYVVDQLGNTQHNPFFIYGPTGLGKTHLMHAVGHQLMKQNPGAKVLYLTSEYFVQRLVTALQKGQVDAFKDECRSQDLLLIDDVHLLAGKEKSLTEFAALFNVLLDQSRQIILTSNRHPKLLTELQERLTSRLSWGVAVEVEPPALETRVEILLKKAELVQLHLPRTCALFIAENVAGNVRELEGALNKVRLTANFKGIDINLALIRESLKDILAMRAQVVNIENIQRVVCEYFQIAHKDLIGPKRTRIFARPRQLAMGLARELTDESFPEIGQAFGGRDHTTVMHACDKVSELRNTDRGFAQDYQELLRLLQS